MIKDECPTQKEKAQLSTRVNVQKRNTCIFPLDEDFHDLRLGWLQTKTQSRLLYAWLRTPNF